MKQPIFLVKSEKFLSSIFVAIALLCAACEGGCNRADLERDRDKEILTITMNDLERLRYINSTNPVLEIGGDITRNNIGQPLHTYAVVTPMPGDIKAAISSFMQNNNKPATDTSIVLPNSLGGVYYHMDVKALQKGRVQSNVYVKGLNPGKYKVHLMAYHKEFGAFYSPESREVEIFTMDANPPSIIMNSVEPSREIDGGKPSIALTIKANTEHATGMKGGFLFIEEEQGKGAGLKPENLIVNGGSIPEANQFKKAFENKAIIYSCLADAQIELNKIKDEHSIFKPGASYQVYAYLMDDNFHDATNVLISSNSVKVVIPKNVVEMTMQEAKVTAMRKCLNNPVPAVLKDIDQMIINCKMKITKHESVASELKLGYLVLQRQLNEEAGIARIKQLLKGTQILNNQVVVYEDSKEFLYLDDPAKLQVNQTGEFTSEFKTPHVPLELGRRYHVYACVILDGHDVFISKNEFEMIVPKVDLTIVTFMTSKSGTTFTTRSEDKITVHEDFQDPGQENARMIGYILYPYAGLTSPTNSINNDPIPGMQAAIDNVATNLPGILDRITSCAFQTAEDLKNGQAKEPGKSLLTWIPGAFVAFAEDIPGAPSLTSTYGEAFDGVPDDIIFQVAKVWCHGNVIFVRQAELPMQRFRWYKVDKKEEKEYKPITLANGTAAGYLYWYNKGPNLTEAELWKGDDNNRTRVKLIDTNRAEIADMLTNVFKGDDAQWVNNKIQQFMNVMNARML